MAALRTLGGGNRSPLGPPTKADAVYDELRRQIIEGELEPGRRLGQEALAAELGVSTTPLREALRRLEAERLVSRSAHSDLVIAPLSAIDLRELYVLRGELEPLAMRLITEHATDDELRAIRALFEVAKPKDRSLRLRSTRAYHHALYAATHNSVLLEVLEAMLDRSQRYRFVLIDDPESANVAISEHDAVLRAIEARDGTRAAASMRDHIEASRDRLSTLLSKQGFEVSDARATEERSIADSA